MVQLQLLTILVQRAPIYCSALVVALWGYLNKKGPYQLLFFTVAQGSSLHWDATLCFHMESEGACTSHAHPMQCLPNHMKELYKGIIAKSK